MTTYTIFERHSDRPHLDGYIGWTASKPRDDEICTYTILHETDDPDEGRHLLLTERFGNDIAQHKIQNCVICWATDPSLI